MLDLAMSLLLLHVCYENLIDCSFGLQAVRGLCVAWTCENIPGLGVVAH